MNKKLVCSLFFAITHGLHGSQDAHRARSPESSSAIPAHQLNLFCDSALRSFGAYGIISSASVLHRLKNGTMLDASAVNFRAADDFVSWVSVQRKTALILVSEHNLNSALCVEYMNHISQQPGFDADWYVIDYDSLAPILQELADGGYDIAQPTNVVPNVLFFLDGKAWQIPEEHAALGLKWWIDRQLTGIL